MGGGSVKQILSKLQDASSKLLAGRRRIYRNFKNWGQLLDFTFKPHSEKFARASLVKQHPFMKALGRPSREIVTTSREDQATLLQALELTNGEFFNSVLEEGALSWLKKYGKNSSAIVDNLYEKALSETFEFEEEAYINDIPFNTKCVASMCNYKKAILVEYEMEEEAYINDIPFDTEKISAESNSKKALEIDFDFEEEAYIDDIPFETSEVTQVYLQSHFAFGK